MQQFYQDYERRGFMTLGDDMVPLRFVAPLEPLAGNIHNDLATLMSTIAGEAVKPSYCYASAYGGGASLLPHVDRPQCEYSFSLQVDYEPLPENGISPWPLFLSLESGEKAVHLANGDCLAYKGCELIHYRNELPSGHRSVSLFLHYVPEDFEGPLE